MNITKYFLTLIGALTMTISTIQSSQLPKAFLKIGHRGACGYEPENTLRSFSKAITMGVNAIELDVYCCKSGELVVIHDDTVNRTTNGTGSVQEKNLTELKQLDAGKGEQIPMLAEVFDLVNRQVIINIELKGKGTAQAVAQLITKYVDNHGWTWSDFIVSSFNHYELQAFAQACPDVSIAALIDGISLGYAKFGSKLNADAVAVSADFINQAFVDDTHARGMRIYVYTVNDLAEISRIKKLGVDGIFSDYPDRL